MTPNESKLLNYLRGYIAQHEFPPTLAECAAHLGIVAKSGAHRIALSLERQGLITRQHQRERSLRPVAQPSEVAAAALVEEHGIYEDDEHDDKLIVCTPAEARETLRRVLGA